MFAKVVKSTVIWVSESIQWETKVFFMESNVVFLSEVRNAMSQALWQKKPIKYPLWYKLLTGPGQVVRFTKNSYEMIPFSESKTSTKFLQILQTEIQKFLDDLLHYNGHFTIPWNYRRGVVNNSEVTEMMLVGHMTMTMWQI